MILWIIFNVVEQTNFYDLNIHNASDNALLLPVYELDAHIYLFILLSEEPVGKLTLV